MALPEYDDFVYKSCLVDKVDPVAEWTKVHDEKEKICSFLNKAEIIRSIDDKLFYKNGEFLI